MLQSPLLRLLTSLSLIIALSACNSLPGRPDIETDTTNTPPTETKTPAAKTNDEPTKLAVQETTKTPSASAAVEIAETAPAVDPPAEPSIPQDLWERLNSDFKLTIPDNKRIAQQARWFTKHEKHLQHIQKRAIPYLYFITEEIEQRKLPGELALLPAIESAFRPFAFSSGRAAGLWQFIPSTGRANGLKQNWWYDGRRDIVAATRAALDHLKALADQFNGDWELALAAYNAGAGAVSKAIRQNKRKKLPTDFWHLNLPRETRNYVPRLLAIAKIFRHPDEYNLSLTTIPNTPHFESIDIGSQLDMELAAKMADISIDVLYRLNPGFSRWATAPKGEGPHRLNIPLEKANLFKEKLARLKTEDRIKWRRYEIKPGDNLGQIAELFGTRVTVLKQINHLNGNNIRAGKHLLIPQSQASLEKINRLQYASQPIVVSNPREYTVRAGDSLWSIARNFKVSTNRLAQWNGLGKQPLLHPGQKLLIKETTTSTKSRQVAYLPKPLRQAQSSQVNYRVRRGDSLYSIAAKFKVSINDLRRWNRFSRRYLHPGQQIRLYVNVAEQSY